MYLPTYCVVVPSLILCLMDSKYRPVREACQKVKYFYDLWKKWYTFGFMVVSKRYWYIIIYLILCRWQKKLP